MTIIPRIAKAILLPELAWHLQFQFQNYFASLAIFLLTSGDKSRLRIFSKYSASNFFLSSIPSKTWNSTAEFNSASPITGYDDARPKRRRVRARDLSLDEKKRGGRRTKMIDESTTSAVERRCGKWRRAGGVGARRMHEALKQEQGNGEESEERHIMISVNLLGLTRHSMTVYIQYTS